MVWIMNMWWGRVVGEVEKLILGVLKVFRRWFRVVCFFWLGRR